jgi:hypothetical protein
VQQFAEFKGCSVLGGVAIAGACISPFLDFALHITLHQAERCTRIMRFSLAGAGPKISFVQAKSLLAGLPGSGDLGLFDHQQGDVESQCNLSR